MGRTAVVGKHQTAKFVFVLVGFLGLFLITDPLRASSSSNWALQKSAAGFIVSQPVHSNHSTLNPPIKGRAEHDKKDNVAGRVLSATFADLEAPELKWEKMATAPVPRLDGAAIQIKNLLYVFAGYGTIDYDLVFHHRFSANEVRETLKKMKPGKAVGPDEIQIWKCLGEVGIRILTALFNKISEDLNFNEHYVHSHVDIYNFTDDTWGGRFDMPKEMAHSHLSMVTDGRYIYVVTGQYGPQCRGPTAHTFVLDTETKQWQSMPPLPVPRYAPATQLWRGRLHVMGGSKENRHTPALEHWSIAVKDGKVLEKEWRTEIPIPRGGPHRACVVFNDHLYVLGGQEGDFMAKPGSPIFKCSRRNEVVYDDVYMLDDDMKWKVLPPMPKPDSHIEFAWAIVNNSLVIVGGTTEKHPVTKRMILVGEIFQFNFDTQKWSVIGKLPYRVKTTLVGFWDGMLYFTSGQRDRGPDDPAPKKVLGEMWRTNLML